MNLATQAVISGLMTGAVYALMGIGLVIVYRTSRILNLAHGECFAVAGIVAALAAARGLPAWLGLLLAVLPQSRFRWRSIVSSCARVRIGRCRPWFSPLWRSHF